ncbi:MAG TPA: hypothetical protein VG984_01230 [Candidatus Paceibacterota bacterium]|nr:hypothetical protein [Candidatus Paceibacterota bacterium]
MKYKALFITAALLAAPLAFAESGQGSGGLGMPPPPPPNQGPQNMQQGEWHVNTPAGEFHGTFQTAPGMPGMASTTFQVHELTPEEAARLMATTTKDGRPIPLPMLIHFNASSTNGVVNVRFGSSTPGMPGMPPPGFRDHMMGSSTDGMGGGPHDDMHGTSTGPRPGDDNRGPGKGIPGAVINFFARLFGGAHDNGNSSTTPPQMRGDQNGEGRDGDMEASTTVDASASSTPNLPPPPVIQFFQNLFGRLFH